MEALARQERLANSVYKPLRIWMNCWNYLEWVSFCGSFRGSRGRLIVEMYIDNLIITEQSNCSWEVKTLIIPLFENN